MQQKSIETDKRQYTVKLIQDNDLIFHMNVHENN